MSLSDTQEVVQVDTEDGTPARGRLAESRVVIYGSRIALFVAFMALWQLAAVKGWVDPKTVGKPSEVWSSLLEYVKSDRARASWPSTGIAVLLSFVIGSATGIIAGLVLGLNPLLDEIVGFFLTPINSVPRIALAPLFIAWFGLTMSAKVFLAVTIVFFILAENARTAMRSVDPDLMVMARIVGLRRVSLLWKVVLPSTVPSLFAGLRLAFTYSLLGVIASEMIAATDGVGQDLVFFGSSFQINTVFAILLLLLCVGMIATLIFSWTESRLLNWQTTQDRD
ncbi:MAG: ABC transporter permease [Nostocoides sp.]